MKIAVPKETYPLEKRVMVLPSSGKILTDAGHELFVQTNAGKELGILDSDYEKIGAKIIMDSKVLYSDAELIVKMKAPSPEEFSLMQNSILFCMLHVGQNEERIFHMGMQNLIGVAMEDIKDDKQKRLVDQTAITGEAGVYYAMRHFEKMPEDMNAVILGYGNVATGAINACSKLGISYKIMRKSEFKYLPLWLESADLLINAITWPKKKRDAKEYLVTREMIKNASPNLIVLDIAVDFPSPVETVHPTTYTNPYYIEEDRIHISIYGYPGLVPKSSAKIYSDQVLPLTLAIANNSGLEGIIACGNLGKHIYKAIVNPKKTDFLKYKPLDVIGSRLE